VEIESLAKSHAGQVCVLGVDVAKFELIAVLRWPDGSFQRPWRIVNPDELGLLIALLTKLASRCPVTVALESSGTYGDALRQALCDAGIPLRRVSAKAVKDQAETFDGVPSQHDGKDAAIIADLCARGKCSVWSERTSSTPADQEMRYWVRKLDAAQRIKQVWGGKVEGMLARHWPEVTRLVSASGATLSAALVEWGGPAALAADPKALQKLRRFGGHYLTEAKIAALIESAKATAGVRTSEWETRELAELAGHVVAQRREIQACKRRLRQLTKNPDDEGRAAIRAQVPVLGLMTACVLWVCLGDPHRYDSAAAYRKAMGLNLVEISSGQFKGRLRISRRGRRLTRKWMYFGALRWMRDPAVRPWVLRKKARDGGNGMRAMVGVMRRLALAAWNVAVNGEAFDPSRLFPGAGRCRSIAKPKGRERDDAVNAVQ